MTLNLKKTLLTGTAVVLVGMLSPMTASAQLTTSGDLADDSYDAGDVAGTDLTDSPVIAIDDASVVTFTQSLDDNDNGGTANNNVIVISAAGGGVTINAGVTVGQSSGTGDVIATAGDIAIGAITIGGTLTASSNTQDAINLASLGAANGATINVNGGGDITGVITGGAGADTLAINTGGANTSTFNGAINLGTGTDAITITGTGGTVNFQGAVTAESVTITSNATVDFDSTLTGDLVFGAGSTGSTADLGNNVTGNISNTSGTSGVGTITTSASSTISGNAGGTGALLAAINNTGAGTLNIQGNAFSTAVTNSGAGTLDVDGNVTADTLTNSAGGTLNIDGTATIATSITNSGAGNLVIDGVTSTGTLTNAAGGAVTVGGAATITTVELDGVGNINFDGTVAATTFNVDGTGTLDFDGTGTVAGNTVFSADGMLDLASTVTTYTGTVTNDSGVSGTGDITLAGVDMVGAIGTSGTGRLGTITLNTTNANSFSANVFAETLTIAAASTNTFNGNLNVTNNVDIGTNNSVLTFGDNASFTGTIVDTSGTNQGVVNFTGTSNVIGNIGTAGTDDVAAVSFNGGTGELVQVTGTVFSNDIEIDGAGSTRLLGQATIADDVLFTADGSLRFADGLVSIADDVDTATDSQGTVTFLGSGDIGGDFGDDTRELSTLTVSGTSETLTVGGNFEAANTNNLNGNVIDVTGTVDFDATQVINTTLTDSTTMGRITADGAASVASGTIVNITADPSIYVANGQSFTLIDGTGGTGVAALTNGNITDDSFLLSFTQDTTSTSDLILTAHRATGSDAAYTTNNSNVLAALDSIGASGDATMDTIQANLTTASTQAEVNAILEALLPTVDGGSVRAGFDASVQSLSMMETRLASLRGDVAGETGMVAGQLGNGVYAWMQGFGQQATQDVRDGVDGYDSETYGAAFGIDSTTAAENATVGMAVSYAATDVESDNINNTQTDVDSYQLSLYGDLSLSKQAYLEGMLGYAYNDINSVRNNAGGLAADASADYNSDQYIAYAEFGRDFALGGKTTLTPSILSHYQHIAIDDYNETGAGGANLNVENEDLDILELGVGAELSWMLKGPNGSIVKPAVNVGYRYDVIGDNVASTSSFSGAPGVSFKTEGFEPDQSTFNAGAGITLATHDNWELSADYDYQMKSDFDSHSGLVRAGYKW